MNKNLHLTLESLRVSRNLNKKQISEKLKIPYSTYCNYEYGYREPSREIIVSLSEIYGVSVESIYKNSDSVISNNKSRLISEINIMSDELFDCFDEKTFQEVSFSIKNTLILMAKINSEKNEY